MVKGNTLSDHQAFKMKEQVNSNNFFLLTMEKLSFSPFLFYFADYLGDKFGDGSFSLKLFLLYLAVKTQEGHLASDEQVISLFGVDSVYRRLSPCRNALFAQLVPQPHAPSASSPLAKTLAG